MNSSDSGPVELLWVHPSETCHVLYRAEPVTPAVTRLVRYWYVQSLHGLPRGVIYSGEKDGHRVYRELMCQHVMTEAFKQCIQQAELVRRGCRSRSSRQTKTTKKGV